MRSLSVMAIFDSHCGVHGKASCQIVVHPLGRPQCNLRLTFLKISSQSTP